MWRWRDSTGSPTLDEAGMAQLIYTPHFDRAYVRFTRRNPVRRSCVDRTLARLEHNPDDPRLKTHMLTGERLGLFACSCGYDCRIIFDWLPGSKTRTETIHLLNVGTHDEVY